MDNKLEKKYGLFTAICLVVGIVIGSGVFFKAQTILQKTNGDMPLGIAAWAIGGLIMITPLAFMFSTSLKTASQVYDLRLIPAAPTLQNYITILADGRFLRWFMNSMIVAVVVTLSNVFLTLVPTLPITVMPATAMRAAIRPYSMAVAALVLRTSFLKNFMSGLLTSHLPC